MTANTQDLRNTLEAQNFQDEQSLNKENRKTLHKMMKYVRTFPLKSIEIEQIRRDLTGMAIEAQQRGTSLQAMLGENPRKFCDEISHGLGGRIIGRSILEKIIPAFICDHHAQRNFYIGNI